MYMYNSLPKILQQVNNDLFNDDREYLLDDDLFVYLTLKDSHKYYYNKNHTGYKFCLKKLNHI